MKTSELNDKTPKSLICTSQKQTLKLKKLQIIKYAAKMGMEQQKNRDELGETR